MKNKIFRYCPFKFVFDYLQGERGERIIYKNREIIEKYFIKKDPIMRIIILLFIFIFTATHPKDIYIIIHGTWATPYAWHMPGGDFHDTLAQSVSHPHNHVSFFLWSGKNNHKKRLDAAQMLVEIIKE